MKTRLIPEVGSWYRDRRDGHLFQVVALDEHDSTVETQSSDGDIDELELGAWFELSLDPAAPPEDSTGPGDPPDRDDREYGLAGEGWLPSLPQDLGGRADAIAQNASSDEYLTDLDELLH